MSDFKQLAVISQLYTKNNIELYTGNRAINTQLNIIQNK